MRDKTGEGRGKGGTADDSLDFWIPASVTKSSLMIVPNWKPIRILPSFDLSRFKSKHNMYVRLRVRYVHQEFAVTVHSYHGTRLEIEATKYVLVQQRKSPSNEWQTEFSFALINSWSYKCKHKDRAFSHDLNTKWINQEGSLPIIAGCNIPRQQLVY